MLVTTPATVPHAYASDLVPAAAGVSSYTYMIEGLPAGTPYTVQVTPINAAGSAVSQTSVPLALAPPLQAPSEPLDVYLAAASANSLSVLWMAPLSDGGSNVTTYKIEWDLAASFDSNNGAPSGYYLKTVTLNTCQAAHCSYVINGLTKVHHPHPHLTNPHLTIPTTLPDHSHPTQPYPFTHYLTHPLTPTSTPVHSPPMIATPL